MLFAFLSHDLLAASSSKMAQIPANQIISVSKMEVWLPPKDNPTDRIVEFIRGSKESIWVQAYQLTSRPIADALLEAHRRGIKIILVVDKTQTGGSSLVPELVEEGIETWIDHSPPIAHNKVFVIDDRTTIGGSFNYSKNATKNAENCTIYVKEKGIAAVFVNNIRLRLNASTPYKDYIKAKTLRFKKDKVSKPIIQPKERKTPKPKTIKGEKPTKRSKKVTTD